MERSEYRLLDVAATLLISFPGGSASDTVVYSIYDVDDAALDVNAVAMTTVTGENWKASWTPAQTNNYIVTFENRTLDVRYYLYVKVIGTLVAVPGGTGTGTTQSNLRSRFLRLIDNYNANDLTGTNSSGDLADLVINNALQIIYADIKNSIYLDSYASVLLVSTADQAYIELSAVSDLDSLVAIKDTTDDFVLTEIEPYEYFLSSPDPSAVTGVPRWYCRIFNRVYLMPRPTAARTYTTEYKKFFARLASDSDTALIPSKYDPWIYEEARVLWLMGEDPSAVGAIQLAIANRDRIRTIYLDEISANFQSCKQVRSYFDSRNYRRGLDPYYHP